MKMIPEFLEREILIIANTLDDRLPSNKIELLPAEADIKLQPSDTESIICPAVIWVYNEHCFSIFKVTDNCFRASFSGNTGKQEYSAQDHEFDNIYDCINTLIQTYTDLQSR